MRVTPVGFTTFRRQATEKELMQLQKNVDNARSSYVPVEDRMFLQVDGGMQAWQRAHDFGTQYAYDHEEGDNMKAAWQYYSNMHTDPSKSMKEEKTARKIFMAMRADFYKKKNEGVELYYSTNEEDGKIAQEVREKVKETEEGKQALAKIAKAKSDLSRALSGEDIENILGE